MMNKEMGDKVYHYRGWTAEGEKTAGLVVALSGLAAAARLLQRGIRAAAIALEPVKTVQWRLMRNYSKQQTAQLFELLGKNLAAGMTLEAALKVSQLFVADGLLRNACEQLISFLHEGVGLPAAMRRVGFDGTDCEVIDALSGRGGYAHALLTRAETLEFESAGEREVSAALMPFALYCIFIYLAGYYILFGVGGAVATTVGHLIADGKRQGFLKYYVEFFEFLTRHQWLFTACYLVSALLLLWLLLGQRRYSVIEKVLPPFSRFHETLDQYRTWQLWYVLSAADIRGVSISRIFSIAARAVSNEKIRRQNEEIVRGIGVARQLSDIIAHAVAVPRERDQLLAIFRGQSEASTAENFLRLLQFDIEQHKKRTVALAAIGSKVIVAAALTTMLLVLLLPQILLAGSDF